MEPPPPAAGSLPLPLRRRQRPPRRHPRGRAATRAV